MKTEQPSLFTDTDTAPPVFNAAAGERFKVEGITKAVENNAANVVKAREIAVELLQTTASVSMDDIMRVWIVRGGKIHDFGNSAGGIFRDRRFEWTGSFITSERIHARGNLLRLWRLRRGG